MALKGQKFKTFTNEERTEIVNKYMSGKYSYAILAKEYNISWKTVESMVRKFKKTGLTIKDKKGKNNQAHLTKEDWKERYEILKKYQQGFHQGVRKSGIGGDDGEHGLEEFMETQICYVQYDTEV